MMDDVDLRNIRATALRAKSGKLADREKARERLYWMEKDFPQYFHNGHFREPKAREAAVIQYAPISADDEAAIIEDIASSCSMAGVEALIAQLEATIWPLLHDDIDRLFAAMGLVSQDGALKKVIVEHLPKILLGRRQSETLARIVELKRDLLMEDFDRAVPFLDECGHPPKGWKPSEIIKIAYFTMATREGVMRTNEFPDGIGHLALARKILAERLEEARRRYAAGFYANPLCDPPVKRLSNG